MCAFQAKTSGLSQQWSFKIMVHCMELGSSQYRQKFPWVDSMSQWSCKWMEVHYAFYWGSVTPGTAWVATADPVQFYNTQLDSTWTSAQSSETFNSICRITSFAPCVNKASRKKKQQKSPENLLARETKCFDSFPTGCHAGLQNGVRSMDQFPEYMIRQ